MDQLRRPMKEESVLSELGDPKRLKKDQLQRKKKVLEQAEASNDRMVKLEVESRMKEILKMKEKIESMKSDVSKWDEDIASLR